MAKRLIIDMEIDAPISGPGEARNTTTQCRLATAALTNEPYRLPPADIEAHSVHGTNVAPDALKDPFPDGEVLLHVTNVDNVRDRGSGWIGWRRRGRQGTAPVVGSSLESTPRSALRS